MNYFTRNNLFDNSDDDEDDLVDLALHIVFPRKSKIIRERPDHFNKWNDQEFLDLLSEKISSATSMNNAVPAALKIILTLRYNATGSFLSVCGDFSGVHKSTASRIVRHEIASLRHQFINFPEVEKDVEHVRQQFYNIAKFPKCIGAIDCTHVRIKSPGGNRAEIYRNGKGYFSFNVQTICDANLRIQNIVCRWPGSFHDSTIWDNSTIRGKFERNEIVDGVLVGDCGYTLKKYLLTPFRNPTTEGENRYNESQIRTRNPVERSYGVWKRRFPILAVGINLNVMSVESVVVATSVLHNIACHFGFAVPRVTVHQENLIEMGQFPPVDQENNLERIQSIQ